ncbi:major facilitator superfamily domain-containing protein [Xylariales sp. AK1849]|nr:major facilitator superfamily domain-containing protein [Xylariales sp. AK1849]
MSVQNETQPTEEKPTTTIVASDTEDVPVNYDAPPNGGLLAWLQVAGCFALYLNTLGLLNTYGVFQTYYELDLLRGSSPSTISWIGSIQSFCLMAIGVFIGPLYDAGYFRALLYTGTFLVTFGFFMTSISSVYWQVFLAQGICIGLGTSCLTIPSIALVPVYFTPPRRAWAMGIATMGSGLGATAYPILFQALQPRIGFLWTVRMLGFISLATCAFAIAVTKPRYKKTVNSQGPEKARPIRIIVQQAKLGDRLYIIYVIAILFNNVGFFEPLYYLQSYAVKHGMQGEPVSSYLLAILNASSLFGRLVPSAMAGRVGIINTFVATVFMSSVSVFYWISASNAAGNIAFAILYGFFAGGVVAFAPVVLTSITDDLSSLGTRLGALSILKGIGSLAGPPIAGAILQISGGYLGVQLFTGFTIMLSATFALSLRLMLGSVRAANQG